jgi:MFS transporter, putative metabolite:H+ symporter
VIETLSGRAPTPDIAARLDRLPLTPLHARIIIVCALGLFFDLGEATLSNTFAATFSAPPRQVAPFQLSLLLASVFVGGALGAPLFGLIADRHGRRLALTAALLMLSVTSLAAASSPDLPWLTACRTLSGLALGAFPPLMTAYLSDVLPPARRGMLILIAGALGIFGAPAVIFLVRWLTPLQPLGLEAWRWALLLGSTGAAILGAMFWRLPESPRWLAAAGRPTATAAMRRFERSAGSRGAPPSDVDATEQGARIGPKRLAPRSIWSAMSDRQHRGRLVLLSAMLFLSPWATIGFPLLSGAVLVEKGFRVADSLFYLGIAMLGPSVGALVASPVIDRVERRATLALCAGALAVVGLCFAGSAQPVPLMAAGCAFTLIGTVYAATLSVYGAELFPTELRASASSAAWAVGRVASTLVPLALLPLLDTGGATAMFGVIAAALIASAVLVLARGPRGLAGKPVA